MNRIVLTLLLAMLSITGYAQLNSTNGDVRLSDLYGDTRVTIVDKGTIVITGTLFIDTSLYLHSTTIQATRVVVGNPNRLMFVHLTKNANITATEMNMPYDYVYLFLINTNEGATVNITNMTGTYAQQQIMDISATSGSMTTTSATN